MFISVDMGCTHGHWWDKPGRGPCGKPHGGIPARWNLPMPLYHSAGPNCTGQTTGTCVGDILEQPANYSILSDRYAAFAAEFIGNVSHDPSPFFLYVPFSHVHTPQYASPRNAGRSGRGHFYDSVLEVDETIGQIVSSLKSSGVADNTLVFVTGDNGPWEVKVSRQPL